MESKKVLFVSQEITPYLPETELSQISRKLPQAIQETGMVLMGRALMGQALLGLVYIYIYYI